MDSVVRDGSRVWTPTTVNTGKWTVEEDAKLTEAVTEFGYDWVQVAALVPGRTNGKCCQRWYKYLRQEH
jgi:hypothetical protein